MELSDSGSAVVSNIGVKVELILELPSFSDGVRNKGLENDSHGEVYPVDPPQPVPLKGDDGTSMQSHQGWTHAAVCGWVGLASQWIIKPI